MGDDFIIIDHSQDKSLNIRNLTIDNQSIELPIPLIKAGHKKVSSPLLHIHSTVHFDVESDKESLPVNFQFSSPTLVNIQRTDPLLIVVLNRLDSGTSPVITNYTLDTIEYHVVTENGQAVWPIDAGKWLPVYQNPHIGDAIGGTYVTGITYEVVARSVKKYPSNPPPPAFLKPYDHNTNVGIYPDLFSDPEIALRYYTK